VFSSRGLNKPFNASTSIYHLDGTQVVGTYNMKRLNLAHQLRTYGNN